MNDKHSRGIRQRSQHRDTGNSILGGPPARIADHSMAEFGPKELLRDAARVKTSHWWGANVSLDYCHSSWVCRPIGQSREQTDDEHAAGLDGHGTHLLHREGHFPCLRELAIVLKESLESGVDICHICGVIRGCCGMRLGFAIGSKQVDARPEGDL